MRSSVFKRMLSSEMLEKKRKEVTIENFSAGVVSMMLTYIYTGSCDVEENQEVAEDLFRIADLYDLQSLKNICLYTIMFSLDIKNCVRLLAFGNLYKAETLKETALEMVAENMEKIVDTDEWKNFIKDFSELAVEVTKRLVTSKKTNKGGE